METEKIQWIEEYLTYTMEVVWLEGYERALKLLDKILYEEPGYSRLHNTLGIIYFKHADDLKKAEQHFRWAIQFNPNFAEPYNYLTEVLKQDEKHDETIDVCKNELKSEKANKTLLFESLGNAWELKHNYRKAIKSYRKALNHSAELWNCRALEISIERCKRKRK
jgi:tetratricopeptide (TPR) repeat protein